MHILRAFFLHFSKPNFLTEVIFMDMTLLISAISACYWQELPSLDFLCCVIVDLLENSIQFYHV